MIQAAGKPQPDAQIAGLAFAMVLLDPELAITELNPAAEDLLGQSAVRLIGRPLFEILDFADARVGERALADEGPVVARGVKVRIGERALRVNLTMSPLAAHPGWRVATISENGQDDMEETGGQASGLRAPAILAHEIKNPLAAIRGAGQLLGRRLHGKDVALAQVIADEADRIARLLDRMQALGRVQPEPVEPFNLHAAVRNALSTVRAAGLAEVALLEEFDPSLPPVLGNRTGLEQVVINLVSNARDACRGREGAAVTVKTRFVSGFIFNAIRPGRWVRLPIELTVIDNGPGVDPGLLDQVFEPFVTSKPSGQGLGLALVKKLVRDMDGRIAHERDERAGLTHFRVHLPVARQEARA